MSHELSNTRQAVLDYAVTHLRQRDESELRVLDLCAAVSISPSVIYAHFRSRQGLVDAALLTILQEEIEKVLDNLRFIADEARQNGNFAKTLYDHITDPANYDMVKKRNGLRIRIFAAALARPSLKKKYLKIDEDFKARSAVVYEGLQRDGILGDGFTPMQWTNFFIQVVVRHGFYDDSLPPTVNETWLPMAESVVAKAFKTPPPRDIRQSPSITPSAR